MNKRKFSLFLSIILIIECIPLQIFAGEQKAITGTNISLKESTVEYSEYYEYEYWDEDEEDGDYFWKNEQKPDVTVTDGDLTLKEGVDYRLEYANNTSVGEAYVDVIGMGKYTGSARKNFSIVPKNIGNCTVYNTTYTGTSRNPAVYIDMDYIYEYIDEETGKKEKDVWQELGQLALNEDYTLTFDDEHTGIGVHSVTINFIGNYTGSVTKTFKILPKDVKNVKSKALSRSSVRISWSKVKGVSGYKVYRWSGSRYKLYKTTKKHSIKVAKAKKDKSGTVDVIIYSYKKIGGKTYKSPNGKYKSAGLKKGRPTFKLVRSDFGEFTIKFTQPDYYQIFFSRNRSFKNKFSYRGYYSSFRLYGCPAGQRYYVKIRRYRYKNGRLKVGGWSKVKSIKVY